MASAPTTPRGAPLHEPWFRRQPRVALAAVAALFLMVFGLRLLEWTSPEAYSMFYVLPVALAASAFGQRGGVAATVVAVGLMVVVAWLRVPSPDAMGWATRVVPIALLGVLLGRATDRVREADAERRRLEMAAQLHRQAIEINDSLVQRMAAAKWSLEAGRTETAAQALAGAMAEANRLVSDLIRRSGMDGRAEPVPEGPEGPETGGAAGS